MKENLRKKRITRIDALFILLLLFMAAFYAWRLPHGYAGIDEGFYCTVPYRLWQGDSLISQEWHVSQLSGLLLYPFMLLYRFFGGTGEGIILTFRYFYGAMQIIVAACIYLCLRRKNGEKSLGALCAAGVFLAFAPFCNTTLSYNTMGIMSLTLCGAMLATAEGRGWKYVVSGLLLACAVLCCPYLIVLYVAYSVCVVVAFIKSKRVGELERGRKMLKAWLCVTAGAAFVALIFVVMLLSRTTPDRIFRSLKWILADPEHDGVSLGEKLYKYFYLLFFDYVALYRIYRTPILIGVIGALSMLLVRAKDARWREHRAWYLAFAGVYTIGLVIMLRMELGYIQRINLALPIAGFCAYALSEEREKNVFKLLYIPGLCYSLLIHLGSNTRFNCISSGLIVSCVASAYMICGVAGELWRAGKKKDKGAAAVLLLCVLTAWAVSGKELATTSFALFDGRMVDERNMLYSYVDKGTHKGLYIAEDEHFDYNGIYESTKAAREAEGESGIIRIFPLSISWMIRLTPRILRGFP